VLPRSLSGSMNLSASMQALQPLPAEAGSKQAIAGVKLEADAVVASAVAAAVTSAAAGVAAGAAGAAKPATGARDVIDLTDSHDEVIGKGKVTICACDFASLVDRC
jgi:hypothetical protein